MNSLAHKISDSFPNEDCFTIQDVGKELGVSVQRVRQLLAVAFKKRMIQNLSKKDGVRVLYPEPMVKKLVDLYNTGEIVKFKRGRKDTFDRLASLKNAELVLQVPVFDESIKEILMTQFGNQNAITEYLKGKLSEIAKPAMAKLQELDAEYDAKRKSIFTIQT